MHNTNQQACVCMALRKASRAVTRLYDHRLAPGGLTTTQYAILGRLADLGELPLTDLAVRMGMDRTSLYRTIAPIERAGWMTVNAADKGRAKAAKITERGRELREQSRAHWADAQQHMLGDLPAEDWEKMLNTLNRLIEVANA